MLSGEGNARERWKTIIAVIGLTGKKQLCPDSILFLYISLPLFCTTTTRNFQKIFYGGNVVGVLVHFFSLPLIFSLHWWPVAFLILSPPLQNFHVVLPTKNVSFVFYLSIKISVALFLVEFRWPAAYSLFLSVFLFLYIPNLWTWQLIWA